EQQLHFADDRHARGLGLGCHRMRLGKFMGNAWAEDERRGLRPVAVIKVGRGDRLALGGIVVPGPDLGTAGGERLSCDEPALAETEHGDGTARFVRDADHRIFSVASPASARIAAMIQKRMTTVGSAQPFFSKW